MFEFNDRAIGPEAPADLVTGDDLTRLAEQEGQNLEGLVGNPQPDTAAPQLAGAGIEFESAEPHANPLLPSITLFPGQDRVLKI
ncbi:MAG TPA: hypothetical protein VMS37_21250 [Verrucomicrobiae bacterium]|nr:hypothetical protein [Verrucomicrobiae bacterium]